MAPPAVTARQEQLRRTAVGRLIGPQVEHLLVVPLGGLEVARGEGRVAEQTVGPRLPGVQRERPGGERAAAREVVEVAAHPGATDQRADAVGVACQGLEIDLVGEPDVAQVQRLAAALHQGVAESRPRGDLDPGPEVEPTPGPPRNTSRIRSDPGEGYPRRKRRSRSKYGSGRSR